MRKKTSIIFEIIPPPRTWDSEKVMRWVRSLCEVMQQKEIYALNLPEVVDETREEEGKRLIPYQRKIDNMRFADIIKKELSLIEPIPNKIVVNMAPEEFKKWVEWVYNKGIRKIVLVGGESHHIQYPGFDVETGAAHIKEFFNDIEVGGITIFTRQNEAKRIVNKIKKGVTFFCSQVVYETDNLKQVLRELQALCLEEQLLFPKIYVSLTPTSEHMDIAFLKWLGVNFPMHVYTYLTEPDADIEQRSFIILEKMVNDLFDFMEHSNIELGFNVEHVRYGNLQLAAKLIEHLKTKM